MSPLIPDPPKPPLGTTTDDELPAGWRSAPAPLSPALLAKIRDLPKHRVSFSAWDELPPRHQSETPSAWEAPPTPLASRRIRGPWPDPTGRYEALLLTLRPTRRDAELAAAARVNSEGQTVHRDIVELEATSLEIVDGRELSSLTDRALKTKDVVSWQLLRAIRDYHDAQAIWITNATGAEEVIVLFVESLGETMHVRDEAVHEVDGSGNSRRLQAAEPPAYHELRAAQSHSRARLAVLHLVIALVAALLVHPILAVGAAITGTEISPPILLVALFGLAVSLLVARPVVRFMRAWRRIVAYVLELPESQEEFLKRLEGLEKESRRRFRD